VESHCSHSYRGARKLEQVIIIQSEPEIAACALLLREAFGTVAKEFGLTEANAPTNPAFITAPKLGDYLKKPVTLYGLLVDSELAGCVAVERSKEQTDVYYIERLAVHPTQRHRGYGRKLLGFALDTIRRNGGTVASIGIMNNNEVLKKWYLLQGFVETELKRFPQLPFEVCFMSRTIER
jgi:ribosomal protein S18 acetylase RimI-like enzyme